MLKVEVIIAQESLQKICSVELEEPYNVAQALQAIGFPLDSSKNCFGVYGKRVDLTYTLKPGDRLEVYRKLDQTPNEKRLKRGG